MEIPLISLEMVCSVQDVRLAYLQFTEECEYSISLLVIRFPFLFL